MPTSTVRIDESGVNELFHSDRGDVRRHMNKLLDQIVFLSRRKVGKRTRRLEHSIGKRLLNTPNGLYGEVAATNHIALIHHEGTRPHVIRATHGKMLRFKQGGRVVYAKQVFHPGTRPNHFLTDAMRAVVH